MCVWKYILERTTKKLYQHNKWVETKIKIGPDSEYDDDDDDAFEYDHSI